MSTEKKTKTGWIWLAALVVASGWASFETVRLAKATDQVAASQEQNLRVAARVEGLPHPKRAGPHTRRAGHKRRRGQTLTGFEDFSSRGSRVRERAGRKGFRGRSRISEPRLRRFCRGAFQMEGVSRKFFRRVSPDLSQRRVVMRHDGKFADGHSFGHRHDNSWINSPPSGPAQQPPRISPVFGDASNFTKPSFASMMRDFRGRERITRRNEFNPTCPRFGFSQTDSGDLRVREDHVGQKPVIH